MNSQVEDYIKYRLKRAHETIVETEAPIEKGLWNGATNRLYYACFYSVGALLLKNKIEASSHSGTLHKFNEVFVKTGKVSRDFSRLYAELFDKRQKADYSDNFDSNKQVVFRMYKPSIEFIKLIETLITGANIENASQL